MRHPGGSLVSFNLKDQWYVKTGKTYEARACSYWGVPHGTLNCSSSLRWKSDPGLVHTNTMTAAAGTGTNVGYVRGGGGYGSMTDQTFNHADTSFRIDQIKSEEDSGDYTLELKVNTDPGVKLDNLVILLERGGTAEAYRFRGAQSDSDSKVFSWDISAGEALTTGNYKVSLYIAPVLSGGTEHSVTMKAAAVSATTTKELGFRMIDLRGYGNFHTGEMYYNFFKHGDISVRVDRLLTDEVTTGNWKLHFWINDNHGTKLDNLTMTIERSGTVNAYRIADATRSNDKYEWSIDSGEALTAGDYTVTWTSVSSGFDAWIQGDGVVGFEEIPRITRYDVRVEDSGGSARNFHNVSPGFQIPDLQWGQTYEITVCAMLLNGWDEECYTDDDFTPSLVLLDTRIGLHEGLYYKNHPASRSNHRYPSLPGNPTLVDPYNIIEQPYFYVDGERWELSQVAYEQGFWEPALGFDNGASGDDYRAVLPASVKGSLVVHITSPKHGDWPARGRPPYSHQYIYDLREAEQTGAGAGGVLYAYLNDNAPGGGYQTADLNTDVCCITGNDPNVAGSVSGQNVAQHYLRILRRPDAPANVVLAPNGQVFFDPSIHADKHILYHKKSGSDRWAKQDIQSGDMIPNLERGMEYMAYVCAFNQEAQAENCSEDQAITYTPEHLLEATLTAGSGSAGAFDLVGYSPPYPVGWDIGEIDVDSFWWNGERWEVQGLFSYLSGSDRRLFVGFGKPPGRAEQLPTELEERLHLKVGSNTYALDGTYLNSSAAYRISGLTASEMLVDGQSYSIALGIEPEAPNAPASMHEGLGYTWADVEQATSYTFRYSPVSQNVEYTVAGAVTSPFAFRPGAGEGVHPDRGQSYDVQVASVNAYGTTWSSETRVAYNPVTPGQLMETGERDFSTSSIMAQFEKPDYGEYLQYIYNYRKMSGGSWSGWTEFTPEMKGNVYTAKVPGLEADSRYVIQLRACLNKDDVDKSGASNTCSAPATRVRDETLRHNRVHQQARNARIDQADIGDNSMVIRWEPAYYNGRSPLSYALYGRKSGESDWGNWIDTINCTSSGPPGACDGDMEATYENLTAGTEYEVRLRVHYQRDQSDADATVYLSATTTGTPPSPPPDDTQPPPPDPPPVQNPALPGTAVDTPDVEWQWSDNDPISVTVRKYQGKPSFDPGSISLSGGSWSVSPGWGDLTTTTVRILTFTRGSESIELHWRIIDGEIEASIVE